METDELPEDPVIADKAGLSGFKERGDGNRELKVPTGNYTSRSSGDRVINPGTISSKGRSRWNLLECVITML